MAYGMILCSFMNFCIFCRYLIFKYIEFLIPMELGLLNIQQWFGIMFK